MRRQSGVTLVEVLVSMVIMALGLVSLAALQNFTLRYQLGSVHRAQLSGLLSDYAERVRSNLGQAPGESGSVSYRFNQANWEAQAADPVAAANAVACTGAKGCTAVELADADMLEWRQRVRKELPRGSVWVDGDATRGLTVSFMWSDKERVTPTSGEKVKADTCSDSDSGLAEQTCCPKNAGAPEGVRCATFSIIP